MPISFDEARRYWREKWLRSVEEVANLDMQHAAWLNPHGRNSHYTFFEYVTCYRYDLSLGAGYAPLVEAGYLTAAEAQAVADFHRQMLGYTAPNDDNNDMPAILRDPEWLKVVAAARAARERLLVMITDADEVTALTQPSCHAVEEARASSS